jgi:ABC-type nitrate/sulfonate/bicarbonate transport system substrate-binding protein
VGSCVFGASSGIYTPADSEIRRPEQLGGVNIAVGYHSGSHFSTIQALEPFLPIEQIKLRFGGFPYDRVDALLTGEVPAAAVWGAATYLVEQHDCRRILDTTFMAGFTFGAETHPLDVERYFRALRRAQMELDLEPERYKHYYLKEIPERYHDQIDVRCFGPGERVVFLPYTEEMYERSQQWMRERGLFEEQRDDASLRIGRSGVISGAARRTACRSRAARWTLRGEDLDRLAVRRVFAPYIRHILDMADMISSGIIPQFPRKFI